MRNTGKRVLVLDDEPDQLETLCRGLHYLGFTCVPVGSAAEALVALSKTGRELVDVLLVDMSAIRDSAKPGASFVERARAARPGLPVLVVTGLARSPELARLADGGLPVLRKPFTPEQLGRAIEIAIASVDDTKGNE